MLKEAIYMATGKQFGTVPYPESIAASKKLAEEGIVLLKNDSLLPIRPQKIALFGCGAWDTMVCGTGSGYAFSPYRVMIAQGLANAGFEIGNAAYYQKYQAAAKQAKKESKLSILDKRWSGLSPKVTEPEIEDGDIKDCNCSTAIYVIQRTTGEGMDHKAEKGDYYLSDLEKKNLEKIASSFKNTIVLLNTSIIDTVEINQIKGVKAILYLGYAGMEMGNAVADILCGKVNPSGHLTDSWALSYNDYPACKTFSLNDGDTSHEVYREGIYVGYRYFDSFNIDVQYPFGYGLSYTDFAIKALSVEAGWQNIKVTAEVSNIGKTAGKAVVQCYASAPKGKLEKPYQELKGFVKTKLLQPEEKETVEIVFSTESLASYSEEKAAWMMEQGLYIIRIGQHSRDTEAIASILVDQDVIVRQLSNKCKPAEPIEEIHPPKDGIPSFERKQENSSMPILKLLSTKYKTVENASAISREIKTYIPEGKEYILPQRRFHYPIDLKETIVKVRNCPNATLQDVKDGKVSMEEFVASLDEQVLLRIITGTGNETKYPVAVRKEGFKKNSIAISASGKTTGQYMVSLGIPQMALCDGPAGLHLMGSNCTAFATGMTQAQTWNTAIIQEASDTYAKELEKYNVNIALGPGMNIHRDPLCGRNFEYYSEDPLLTGKCACAFTLGLQSNHPHCGVSLKHFACNNQEMDRVTSSSDLSERALREIYLKGFEICVRNAAPKTIMSSYNCINGIHSSSNYELLTDILRGEWGFEGLIMTDWDSQSVKPYDFHAGNDIIMGGYNTDKLTAAYSGKAPEFTEDGAVIQKEVKAYGGFFKNIVDEWNSFEPSKDGKDTAIALVKKDVVLSERVNKAVEEGLCEIKELENGDRQVIWKGLDRGAWLTLGDIQKCAISVLNSIIKIMM